MAIRKRVLGEEHPDTLTSMSNLAFTLKKHGRDEEAIKLMEDCKLLQELVLGAEHPNTLSSTAILIVWNSEESDTDASDVEAIAVE
jgi:hypothetical protein